jgi:hypothetical protein
MRETGYYSCCGSKMYIPRTSVQKSSDQPFSYHAGTDGASEPEHGLLTEQVINANKKCFGCSSEKLEFGLQPTMKDCFNEAEVTAVYHTQRYRDLIT